MIGPLLVLGAAALALYAFSKKGGPPPSAELAPLDVDARFNGRDFMVAPSGVQIVRPESIMKVMGQLQQRATRPSGKRGKDGAESFYLVRQLVGAESARDWAQKESLAKRSVLLALDQQVPAASGELLGPAMLISVPSSETPRWAVPGRAVLIWGGA